MGAIPPAIFDGHLPLHKGGFAAYHQQLWRGTRGRDQSRPYKGPPVGAGFIRPSSWALIQPPPRAAEVGAVQRCDYTHQSEMNTPTWGPGVSPGAGRGEGFVKGLGGTGAGSPRPLTRRRHSQLLVNTSKVYLSVTFGDTSPLRRGGKKVGEGEPREGRWLPHQIAKLCFPMLSCTCRVQIHSLVEVTGL